MPFTSFVQTCGSTFSTAACPPAGGAFQTDSSNQGCSCSAGAALLSRCQAVSSTSFPPSWVNQGCKEQMGTTCMCIFLRCWHSAPSTQSSITLILLPDVVWCLSVVKNLLCPQQSLLCCVRLWCLPLKLLTDFLVSDWRQNRDN